MSPPVVVEEVVVANDLDNDCDDDGCDDEDDCEDDDDDAGCVCSFCLVAVARRR